jgi:hypothetical protein
MNIEINEKELPQDPIIAKQISIRLIEMVFNQSATFDVSFYKSLDDFNIEFIKREFLTISGNEYMEWKNDDDYVIKLLCTKLGVSKKK